MIQQTSPQTQPPPALPAVQWPPEAFQMAAAYQLGPPNAVYRGRAKARVLLAKLFLIAIFPLTWGILLVLMGISPASNGMEAGPLQYVALLGGIVLLGVGVTLIWWVIKDAQSIAGWWVVVCPDGFVFRKSKDKAKAVHWDQVNTVRFGGEETYVNGIHTGSFFRVLADLKDGAPASNLMTDFSIFEISR